MWYGKLAVIFMFSSFAILFSGYFANQVFNDPVLSANSSFNSINTIVKSFSFNVQFNSALIFGDFVAAYNVISNLMAGSIYQGAFGDTGLIHGVAGIGVYVSLLSGLLFDSSVVFLLIYIISFRSI